MTAGISGVIRHPSYLGALVFMLGGALVFRSGVGILLTAVTVVPLLARIASEKTLLQSRFGAEYDAYRARTGGWCHSFTDQIRIRRHHPLGAKKKWGLVRLAGGCSATVERD